MAKNQTSLIKGDNLSARGRAFKTILFEIIREESLLDLSPNANAKDAEKAFIAHCAERAFDPKDSSSAIILKEFLSKSYPGLKPTLEKIEFNFPENGTPVDKALSVVKAISEGQLPADIGQIVISIIKDSVVIEESTDLKARLIALEEKMGLE